GGIPGTLLGGTTHIPTDWDWCTIDLSALDVNVNEGAIYVAFQYLTDAPDCEALSFDETAPQGHSWQRASNETWLPVEMTATGPGNWLIRCSVEQEDCLWLSENPDSGIVAPGDSNDITVTVDATGLAPGEQGASVLVCSNDPESNTVTLPVSVTVLPAADLVPTILCAEWDDVSSGVYTITLAVANEGLGNAAASAAQLLIDSVEAAQYAVPALGPAESFSAQFGPITLSDDADDLSLVVDTNNEVSPEGSEVNNHVSQTVDQPVSTQVQFTLHPGWNMVSVPLLLDDDATGSIFPNAEAIYTWNPVAKSYVMPATIEPGLAYWVAVIEETIVTVDGLPVTEHVSELTPGWHMLGSVQGTAADFSNPHDAPSGSVESLAYRWDPLLKSYVQTVSLEEGAGYW
ncbi:hypothetical protein KAJ02_02835, partial [Candidatus Bipolaricaulota bacterium]|nr:hypothetical protein [Candidatus Bipolaricaulota bacterium]